MRTETFTPHRRAPVAIVLGTQDVASAVAHALFHAGYGVVLSRDPGRPVLRRSMSYDDALVTGFAEVAGLPARPAHALVEVLRGFTEPDAVMVTALELGELLCLGLIDLLVDARLRMRGVHVDLRPYARLSVGLGPGFTVGRNVDVAIETAPGAVAIVTEGGTRDAPARTAADATRFARAPRAGIWTSGRAIGERVGAGEMVGLCDDVPILSPAHGSLRGLVRSGVEVPEGLRLVEVDGAGAPSWLGFSERAISIAGATLAAVEGAQVLRTATPQGVAN